MIPEHFGQLAQINACFIIWNCYRRYKRPWPLNQASRDRSRTPRPRFMQEARGSDSLRVEFLDCAFDNLIDRHAPGVVLQRCCNGASDLPRGYTDIKVRNRVNFNRVPRQNAESLARSCSKTPYMALWQRGETENMDDNIRKNDKVRNLLSQPGVERGLLQR
jgi:hypothetical protein